MPLGCSFRPKPSVPLAALAQRGGARAAFGARSYTNRKEYVRQVESAKGHGDTHASDQRDRGQSGPGLKPRRRPPGDLP